LEKKFEKSEKLKIDKLSTESETEYFSKILGAKDIIYIYIYITYLL